MKDKNQKIHKIITRYVNRKTPIEEREDLIQDVWEFYLQNKHKYNPKRGSLTTFIVLYTRQVLDRRKKATNTYKRQINYGTLPYFDEIYDYGQNQEDVMIDLLDYRYETQEAAE